ncbi:MAG TPA: single-stranded DNA-binding protein [candidate division Zixibacteria bacterium]|nr:single-stranded DNA-binding protein [candidate division Zixibacteria bacterium]
MGSVNKVILIGNLGRDPELKYLPSGRAVTEFPIATTDRWKDQEGNQQERTEWHNIVLWGRQAEIAKEYLAKGRSVYIEGRIQTRSWDDQDGNKRYKTEIVGEKLQFLGSRGDNAGGSAPRDEGASAPAGGAPGGNDDDLPF